MRKLNRFVFKYFVMVKLSGNFDRKKVLKVIKYLVIVSASLLLGQSIDLKIVLETIVNLLS